MTDRFLEFGVPTTDILESLHFYRSLGFTELSTADIWPHKYAVVTDGKLVIGLHEGAPEAGATLTLVQPSLRRHALAMQDAGTQFETLHIDEDEFNHAIFRDPCGIAVMLVEARTYSPPMESPAPGAAGRFLELALPVHDVVASARFWAPLAPTVAQHRETPATRFRLRAKGLIIGLGETPRLGKPLLVYHTEDAVLLQERLDLMGREPDPGPDFGSRSHGLIEAPEGTGILLLRQDYWEAS